MVDAKKPVKRPGKPALYRVPNFTKLYATNVQGGPTNQDFRFHVMNEKLRDEDGWHSVSDALIILTPAAAKNLLRLLETFIRRYEKDHGPVQTDFKEELTY